MSFSNEAYWDGRYRNGRSSGVGSEGAVAIAKADYVAALIEQCGVRSVIDWGCGDGVVLGHITAEMDYTGIDVSRTILEKVAASHPQHKFLHFSEYDGEMRDLGLSLDVLFHFPNDRAYQHYLMLLFGSSKRLVCIYATDDDRGLTAAHVRRRNFTRDVELLFPQWQLVYTSRKDGDPLDEAAFYVYEKG